MMSNGPCAQSSCGGGVTYTPPAGGGSGNGSGGGSSGGGATYTPPAGGGSGGGSGNATGSGSLVEAAKQEQTVFESDLWAIGLFLVAAYLIMLYVALIVRMIKGKRMTTKAQDKQEKQITLSGRVVEEDDGEPLDDEVEETEVDEEKERAWREDLALIVAELDEQDRAKAEAENEKIEEEQKQTETVLKQLEKNSKVPEDDDWEELFNKYKKD